MKDLRILTDDVDSNVDTLSVDCDEVTVVIRPMTTSPVITELNSGDSDNRIGCFEDELSMKSPRLVTASCEELR